jgi:predicted PurR-regulated permease PerM
MREIYKTILVVCAIVLATYFFFTGLIQAKTFLAPLTIAVLLSLIVYPAALKFEKLGLSRGIASFLSTLIVFITSLSLVVLLTFQFQNFVEKWPEIKETMLPKIERIEVFASENSPMSKQRINKIVKSGNPMKSKEASSPAGKQAMSLLMGTAEMLGTFLLTMIYVFFILRYRKRFKYFLFRISPKKNRSEIKQTLSEISRVISGYLVGKLILMGILLVCYLLGLGFSGVDNFILVSLIAVVLNLIPYLGNVIGFSTALAYGYLVSGDFYVLIGVVGTFSISLFIETYILQPYIMGSKVNVHPFLVIVMVILGGALWGISGMILAVPFTAILTVLLLHLPYLKSVGLLLSKKELNPNK